jgi:hypothetical protein
MARRQILLCAVAAALLGCSESTGGAGDPEPLTRGAVITLGGETPTRSAIWYDLATRSFHTFDAGSAIPPGGRSLSFGLPSAPTSLLFLGGYASASHRDPRFGDSEPSANGVVLDPETGESEPVVMSEARVRHAVTPMAGNLALVTGGFNAGGGAIQSAEIFDLATRTFTPLDYMLVGRGGHAAAMLPDGRVLITGGWVPDGGGPHTPASETSDTEIYDPELGTFLPNGDMSGGTRFNHSAVALDDGRVLLLGGDDRFTAEVFDPTAGTFTRVGDMSIVHGVGHAAVKLQDGRVLVLGGAKGDGIPSAVAEVFDPATDSFTRIEDMTTPRRHHFAVLLPNGEVLIGGGENADGEILASAEIYDPVADTFTAIEDMPVAGTEQAAVAVDR